MGIFERLRLQKRSAEPETNANLGPFAAMVRNVLDGSIGLDAAKVEARTLGGTGAVSSEELVSSATVAKQAAAEGNWVPSIQVAELSYEAARAAHEARTSDVSVAKAWLSTGADMLMTLHSSLLAQGDLRLYLRAEEIASQTITEAENLNLPQLRGLLSLRFGTLLLDAYTANRSPQNYESQFDAWVARAMQTNDPELRFLASDKMRAEGEVDSAHTQPAWPQPLVVLERAEKHLRAALPLLIPERRGGALKALAESVLWRGLLGGPSDHAEVRALAEEALHELDPNDSQSRLGVLGVLHFLDVPTDSEELVRMLERNWDHSVATMTQLHLWDAVGQAAALLQDTDPVRGLRLLARRRELTDAWDDDNLRFTQYQLELDLFCRAYRPAFAEAAWKGDLDSVAQRSVALAATARSPEAARESAAALITAMLASTRDRETLGLALVEPLAALDRSLWDQYAVAVEWLIANLLRGEGVNRMRADDLDNAASYYRQAVNTYQRIGMAVPMVQCLEYLDDVVIGGGTKLDELTAWLATCSLDLELTAPAAAPAVIQRLATHLLAIQAAAAISPEVIQLLFQVAKGRRFAAMLAGGTRGFRLPKRATHLLAQEAKAEATLPEGSDILRPAPFDAGLDEDTLVTAWVDEHETGPSDTPIDRLANLQRAVECVLTHALVPDELPPIVMLADIRRRLDTRTALLMLFEGASAEGNLAMWQFVLTKELVYVVAAKEDLPYSTVAASDRGRSVTMPPSGFYVGAVRESVQRDPGPLDIAPDGAEELVGAAQQYLLAVTQHCEELKARGVERLVIVPHGASHYMPIHLAGPKGNPLANDWTVIYLSNLAQLTVDPVPGRQRRAVGVFALSYADQPGLPRLDDSAVEARAIAEICGTTARIDEEATEPEFIRALESCRYVHLRAHGRMYVDAPSFHTVFLHPADGHDGRLRAYEVLPLDLTGLELITLGACETALGRVDRSDNPRGLPSALLLAGARAVVGTLWPVLAEASTCFFTALYRAVMSDGDVVAAFATAQQTTRRRFPQYRDWGAFYLIGGLTRSPQHDQA